MKKIMVIGGLGYIGQVLYEELQLAKLDCVIVDSDGLGFASKEENQIKKFEQCDIRNAAALEAVFKNYDGELSHVINLAAIVGDPACCTAPKKSMQTNVLAARTIAELCNKYNVKLIHASTCSLYGSPSSTNGTPSAPFTEDDETWPVDFYGLTKKEQETIVRTIAKDACVFRFGTAYGESPRMRYDLVVNVFAAQASKGETLNVYGGTAYRPFVHIRDISRALIHAIQNNLTGVYNLTNENIQIEEVAKILNQKTQCPVNIVKSVQDPRNYFVISDKLLKTGFVFKHTIEMSVDEIIREAKWRDISAPEYHNDKIESGIRN